MLGFYIGLGVAILLFVAGYFAWTPIRIAYRESVVVRQAKTLDRSSPSSVRKAEDAALTLLHAGPKAEAAVARLLGSPDPNVRFVVVSGMYQMQGEGSPNTWWLPLAVKASGDSDKKVVSLALTALWEATHGAFCPDEGPDAKDARDRMLAWWDREGKAKYGRGE